MAKKAPVFMGVRLFLAIEQATTKNQLLDLAVDVCRAEIGADASDHQVIEWLQRKLQTVWQHRGDPPIDLAARYDRLAPPPVPPPAPIKRPRRARHAQKHEAAR